MALAYISFKIDNIYNHDLNENGILRHEGYAPFTKDIKHVTVVDIIYKSPSLCQKVT